MKSKILNLFGTKTGNQKGETKGKWKGAKKKKKEKKKERVGVDAIGQAIKLVSNI